MEAIACLEVKKKKVVYQIIYSLQKTKMCHFLIIILRSAGSFLIGACVSITNESEAP